MGLTQAVCLWNSGLYATLSNLSFSHSLSHIMSRAEAGLHYETAVRLHVVGCSWGKQSRLSISWLFSLITDHQIALGPFFIPGDRINHGSFKVVSFFSVQGLYLIPKKLVDKAIMRQQNKGMHENEN